MDPPNPPTDPAGADTPKKSPFDDLSRDELIKKCKGLLVIAQKSKKAKADTLAEIETLKEKCDRLETQKHSDKDGLKTMQEFVDTLTEQKLTFATEIDTLKKQVGLHKTALEQKQNELERIVSDSETQIQQLKGSLSSAEAKLSTLDTENTSLTRLNGRMEKENEDLIKQLDELEKQISVLNQLGLEQRNQLLELEKNSGTNSTQQSASQSLMDVEKLSREIEKYKTTLETIVEEKESISVDFETFKRNLQTSSEGSTDKQNEIEEMKGQLESTSNALKEAEKNLNDRELKLSETSKQYEMEKLKKEKVNAKLKIYKEKLIKCSSSITQLKNSKFILLKTVSEYSESVPKWQRDIMNASKLLSEQLLCLEAENKTLKERASQIQDCGEGERERKAAEDKSLEINMLKNEKDLINSQLMSANERYDKTDKEKEYYRHELKHAKAEKDVLVNNIMSLESEKLILINEKKSARDTIQKMEGEKNNLEEAICGFNEAIAKYVTEIKNLKETVSVLEEEKENLVKELQAISADRSMGEQVLIKSLGEEIGCLKSSLVSVEEENKLLAEANDNLKKDVENLTVSLDQPNPQMYSLMEHNNVLQTDISKMQTKMSAYKTENSTLRSDIEECRQRLAEVKGIQQECEEVKAKLAMYKTENAELLTEMKEINHVLKERGETISKQDKKVSEAMWKVQSLEEELKKIKEEKESMVQEIKTMTDRLNEKESRLKLVASQSSGESEWKIERENLEALLKERDGIIVSLNEDVDKYKQNQGNYSYDAPSENMSMSTVSRMEESSRLKDVDESFEERYAKLRMLALKLKKKVGQLTIQLKAAEDENSKILQEKTDMAVKLDTAGSAAKNVLSIQTEYDKMADKLDQKQAEFKSSDKACKELQNEVNKLTADLEEVNGKVAKGQKDLEFAKKEKEAVEMVVKELQKQLNSSQKGASSSKNSDVEITKLKAELAAKESQLALEVSSHQTSKDALEKARRDVKKKSVLSKEMEDYERSMEDLTNKMEDNKKKIVQMESTIDTQDATINSLKTQIKMLEEQLQTEERISKESRDLLNHATDSLKENEVVLMSKTEVIASLERALEEAKLVSEDLNLQLASALTDKEKSTISIGQERSEMIAKVKKAENRCGDIEERLRVKTVELDSIKAEFNGYKVRAQSVLRQNQTKDLSLEENLKEEMAALQAEVESLKGELETTVSELETAQIDRSRLGGRCSELQNTVTSLQNERDLMAEKYEAALKKEAQEQKNIKLQMSTLTQCYKKQIADLEERTSEESSKLRKELDFSRASLARSHSKDALLTSDRKTPLKFVAITTVQDAPQLERLPDVTDSVGEINVSLLEREEGEGSESTPSPSPTSLTRAGGAGSSRSARGRREPVPLAQLLEGGVQDDPPASYQDGDVEDRLAAALRQIDTQDRRLAHMTELVAEAEREVARRSQLGEALKEEVRRCQRALDRGMHHHNQEYLKNVIVKFLTLGAGDERSRLVPVLHTILTLSPEETQQLNAVAKGMDPNANRGWGSYLPWPGNR